MKTLYLHIGTPKTATSSIQKFLAENWDVLQKHGYFFPESTHIYPRVNARRNAHFLSGRVRNGEGIRDKEKEKTYLEEGLQQVSQTSLGKLSICLLGSVTMRSCPRDHI